MASEPPVELVPLPTTTVRVPPRPADDGREPTAIAPLLEPTAVPELNCNLPLLPATPAFELKITIDPLLLAVPSPLAIFATPPVCTELRPAHIRISPELPLVPLPTLTTRPPARPAVADPEPMKMSPELPESEVPELKISAPLEPSPESAETMLT